MRNFLLTCFLALLCLVGRYLAASSKVADSPQESPLHRSDLQPVSPHSGDTHRGGPILSDTFPGIDFGLVDSDQDMGAGEEAYNLQPAPPDSYRDPVTVLPTLPLQTSNSPNQLSLELSGEEGSKLAPHSGGLLSVDNGPRNETAASLSGAPHSDDNLHRSSEIRNPTSEIVLPTPGFSLVDNSTSQGQEEGNTPARVGEETLFYLELPALLAADTLWLTYWEHFLDDKATPGTTIPLIAFQGDFFQGNMGHKSYFWSPSSNDGPLFFKIRNNKTWLINTFTILPGDQVRIRKDLSNGQSYFIGPAAKFFRAQDQLASLSETQKIKAHPLMITNNPDRILSDSMAKLRYHQALNLPRILFPPMVFMPPGTDDTALIDSLFSESLAENELIQALPNLFANLSPVHQSWLSQQAWGEALSISLSRLSLVKEIILEPEYLQKYETWKSFLPAFLSSQSLNPLFLQANYELALLDAYVYDMPLSKVLESQEQTLRDHIIGRYLISGFKRREADQSASLLTGLEIIQTPWIRQQLIDLQTTALPGSPFDPTAFTDLNGNAFDLHQFEGKSLVISFWISGCKFCIKYYESTLQPVFEQYKDRNDIVFISVNADTNDKFWKENLATGRYAHPDMVNLHQDSGTGVLKQYQISSFPQKLLISPDFHLFLLTQTQYPPDQLSNMIESMTSKNLSFSTSKPK